MPVAKFKHKRNGQIIDLTPSEKAFEKLYLINTLNTAGVGNKPIKFDTYAKAAKASPMLAKIIDKLEGKEVRLLNQRIEALQ